MDRLDLPMGDGESEPIDELATEVGQNLDSGIREMVPVKGVEHRAASLLGVDKAVIDEVTERALNTRLRAAAGEFCYFATSETVSRTRECDKDFALDRRAYRRVRPSKVHLLTTLRTG
ncbi:MAG TPA: hypothetical protein VFA34_11870 [Actinomycetota bacterium]|nr:hypothetical protein [Actinomycetota bacterium]